MIKFIARLFNWSPVGKSVVIHIDDSADATIQAQSFNGLLQEINDVGIGIIHLNATIKTKGQIIENIYVKPRHRGYGFYHLLISFIAVYVTAGGGVESKNDSDVLAIASLRIGTKS